MAAHLFRKMNGWFPLSLMRHVVNCWPPFLGAGIRVLEGSEDFRFLKVELKRSWYNINYVGVQFGGSIYALVDPFYMLMLMNILGREYIVWDKAARIEFLKPGKTALTAEFKISDDVINTIRERTSNGKKYVFDLPVEITDNQGLVIARVEKTLYVRLKKEGL